MQFIKRKTTTSKLFPVFKMYFDFDQLEQSLDLGSFVLHTGAEGSRPMNKNKQADLFQKLRKRQG